MGFSSGFWAHLFFLARFCTSGVALVTMNPDVTKNQVRVG
jgi:hypothetical protein